MTLLKKVALAIYCVLLMVTASSCSKGESNIIDNKNNINININVSNYPKTIIMESKNEKLNIYKTDRGNMTKIDSIDNISDMVYNNDNSIYGFVVKDKNDLKKNNIKIINKTEKKLINDFYFAKDLKLSPSGNKLAYRSFKSESLDSAQGLSLYDIGKHKKVALESEVLISGNLYQWISDEDIIYYGATNKKGKNTGIFKYNTKEHKEEMYLDNINGYCTYFMWLENIVLILSKNIEENKLYLYNKEKDINVSLSSNIENVYDGTFDKKNKLVYIIASDKNVDMPILYKIDLNTFKMERINYDFPKAIDPQGGMHVDSEGLLYYCGFTSVEGENNKNEVFMYDPKDNSNNLISINPSQYKVNGTN